MSCTQFIEVQGADEQAPADHISTWHRDQFGVAPGYRGARLLANTDRPGRHLIAYRNYRQVAATHDRT